MTGIQELPYEHRFALTGTLTISGIGKHTWADLDQHDAGDVYKDLLNLWDEDGRHFKSPRIVLQYAAGSDDKEAGSAWFDVESGDVDENAEVFADSVIGYLYRISEGFRAGEKFVA